MEWKARRFWFSTFKLILFSSGSFRTQAILISTGSPYKGMIRVVIGLIIR